MPTDEMIRVNRKQVAALVRARAKASGPRLFSGDERRRYPRWPFPGAVELSPVGGDGRVRWFATCGNISEGGFGVIADRSFEPDTPLEFSCHLPEATLVGQAVVRHCVRTPEGYMVGLEFNFMD